MKTEKLKHISFGMPLETFEKSKISKAKVTTNALVKAMVANYHKLPKEYQKMCVEYALENNASARNIPMTPKQQKAFNSLKDTFKLTSDDDSDRAALRCALRKAGITNLTLNVNKK